MLKNLNYVWRNWLEKVKIFWIFVFPPFPQGLHALCLPIIYIEQYFKEKIRCPWLWSLQCCKETAALLIPPPLSLSVFLPLFSITFFFVSPPLCSSNLPSALQWSSFISFFCHLTLLLIAQSLCPLTVIVVENTQSLTDKHRYTHT